MQIIPDDDDHPIDLRQLIDLIASLERLSPDPAPHRTILRDCVTRLSHLVDIAPAIDHETRYPQDA